MLQTDDVGKLFSIFRAAYGYQWPHGADDIPVWQQKLKGWSATDVMKAANTAIDTLPNRPPSIGQLVAILKTGKPVRQPTYLPAPKMDPAMVMANRLLTQIIRNHHGVDSNTLRCLVDTKNLLVGELDRKPDEAFLADLEAQLTELAGNQNAEHRRRDQRIAWERFCVDRHIERGFSHE